MFICCPRRERLLQILKQPEGRLRGYGEAAIQAARCYDDAHQPRAAWEERIDCRSSELIVADRVANQPSQA